MADAPEVEQKEAQVVAEQEEVLPTSEVEEVVSAEGEAVESAESEVAVEPPATEEPEVADKDSEVDSPKENGDKNGVAASNGSGLELKRKSLVAEAGDTEVEVVEEKKAKLAEESDSVATGEEEAEANGIEAN